LIVSKDNKILKAVRFLNSKKGRDEKNQFVIEGLKFVKEIPSAYSIDFFVVSENFKEKNEEILKELESRAEVHIAKTFLFNQLSNTKTPQGILAVVNKKIYNFKKLPLSNGFFLIGENLQDPGNVGTLIRTADAAGADALILGNNCVDLYNSKTIRATAGSIFNLPIIEVQDVLEVIEYFKENKINVLAAHLSGEKYLYEVDFTQNIAIIIGNEGNGISDAATGKATSLVKIPMIGQAESLNASIASGILLYEVVRQRINMV